ncbi:sugar-binding transcriptional regulator [Clostridium sp. Marseille-P3244]|uniref:sugar-binding transcriptional regulator n=1 Tax=Clostridium sp. Marseille-P3244 TaxID=1871020 RepID=UPI00093124FA|nr:sugar-binding domain-containing protein [Clostridium sp. Marseille-P3244]
MADLILIYLKLCLKGVSVLKSEVYSQSSWLAMKAASLYYIDGLSGKEIAGILNISPSTVSRLLTKSKTQGIISFRVNEPYAHCLRIAEEIRTRYGLRETIVVPAEGSSDPASARHAVALEGARFLQRIIDDNDVFGIAWGRTINYLIQVLNPCLKINNSFVTLHGSVAHCQYSYDVKNLVSRIAMAFGGKKFYFTSNALCSSPRHLADVLSMKQNRIVKELFSRITVSVSGCGSLYPDMDSPLLAKDYHYLTSEEWGELKRKGVYGDILLRFFDENGQECDTSLKDRTLSIDFDEYKKIPTKVIVAADKKKAYTMRAILRGGLADVLIVDYDLARELLEISDPEAKPFIH